METRGNSITKHKALIGLLRSLLDACTWLVEHGPFSVAEAEGFSKGNSAVLILYFAQAQFQTSYRQVGASIVSYIGAIILGWPIS